jgi:hypothetical protein
MAASVQLALNTSEGQVGTPAMESAVIIIFIYGLH